MNILLETPRLYLRQLQQDDRDAIAVFLQDEQVMYAWEHGFSQEEVDNWLQQNLLRYQRDGYSYWAVMEKESQLLIGVCGILAETANEKAYTGIGYIFRKDYWHKGYALESAKACMDYGFQQLRLPLLTAQIRPENTASRKLAEKLGMQVIDQFTKHYRGKEMVHLLYGRTP